MNDISITLVRVDTGPDGTFGILYLPESLRPPKTDTDHLHCAEPPWRDNRANISCIPPDRYICTLAVSPTYGLCPHILDVPGRTDILIHWGNWAGDTEAGLYSDSAGCVLAGSGFAIGAPSTPGYHSQKMVSSSKLAFEMLIASLEKAGIKEGDRFELQIIDATGNAGRGWNDGIR